MSYCDYERQWRHQDFGWGGAQQWICGVVGYRVLGARDALYYEVENRIVFYVQLIFNYHLLVYFYWNINTLWVWIENIVKIYKQS